MFEKATAEEKKYLDEYRELTARESLAKDQALERVKELEAQIASKPVERKAAPPEPAPAPAPPAPPVPVAAPLPPRPTFNEFIRLPSHEKARLRQIHGANLEDELGEAWEHEHNMGNLRRGNTPGFNVRAPGGGGLLPESPYRAEDYRTPLQISRDHAARMNAQIADPRSLSENDRARLDSLNSPGSPGRRLPAPSSSVPFTPAGAPPSAPRPGHKSRHLGGFGIRE